jgi:hypothetical protein
VTATRKIIYLDVNKENGMKIVPTSVSNCDKWFRNGASIFFHIEWTTERNVVSSLSLN